MSTDRLPDRRIDALTRHVNGAFVNNATTVSLAREVQAGRKLLDDLLARHRVLRRFDYDTGEVDRLRPGQDVCDACGQDYPCPTRRMIEEARRG